MTPPINESRTLEVNATACREATERWYLAFVLYREARGEPIECRIAVGWSVLNRVARPKWWGRTLDEVITKRWQYSSLTDPSDPQLARVWPVAADRAWQECFEIAVQLLEGRILNPVPGADSYFDVSLAKNPPKWTLGARFCGQIGRILFYDVDHDYETGAMHT